MCTLIQPGTYAKCRESAEDKNALDFVNFSTYLPQRVLYRVVTISRQHVAKKTKIVP